MVRGTYSARFWQGRLGEEAEQIVGLRDGSLRNIEFVEVVEVVRFVRRTMQRWVAHAQLRAQAVMALY